MPYKSLTDMKKVYIGNDAIYLSKKVLEKKNNNNNNNKNTINFGAIINLKNTHARVLENSRIWGKTNIKNRNTRPHFFTNRVC